MLGAAAMLILAVLMGCETSTAWNVGVGADLNDDGEVGSNPVGFVELVASSRRRRGEGQKRQKRAWRLALQTRF